MSLEKLIITTSDGQTFDNVSIKLRDVSKMISEVLADSTDPNIPLLAVDAATFKTILEYLESHDYNLPEINKPIKSADLKSNVHEKDYALVKDLNINSVKPLLDAALYLGIRQLEELSATIIATHIFFDGTQSGLADTKKRLGIQSELNVNKQKEIEAIKTQFFD